jgi:membrane protease YdiL (CAAX protease family)
VSFFRLAIAGEAGLLLLAWGLGEWLGISPVASLRFELSAVATGLVATLPLLLGLAWVLSTSWGPARRLVTLVEEQLGPLLAGRSVAELALLALLAGISEEILFRGLVQVGLTAVLPEIPALIVASAAFGLVHFASPAYACLAGVMGLYLGSLLLLQGNLVTPILTHALYDLVALAYVAQRARATLPVQSYPPQA